MSLTTKYTLYVFFIFGAILFLGFYLINVKADSEMERLASTVIYNTVVNLSDVVKSRFEMIPYLATHGFDEKKLSWLKSNYMYFGGSGVDLDFQYKKYEDKNLWYIEFSGTFEVFRINDATLDLYGFFKEILERKVKLKGGYFYVSDSDGNVVFHTIKERLGLNIVKEGLKGLLDEFLKRGSGYVEYVYKGNKIKAFFKEIDLPFEVVKLDENGKEEKVRFFLVSAVSIPELKAQYAGFIKIMYSLVLPLMLVVVTAASYGIAKMGVRNLRHQSEVMKELSGSLSNTLSNLSTSAAEMEKIAENNNEIAKKLSEVTQNFATSVEEGRYEVDSSLKSIRSFISLLSKVNEEISQSVSLIESLTDLNDRIAYLSDTISVLAINASIESSKERIDREGIAKIVEHITKISSEARETAKQTRKTIDSIQRSVSQLALYSERVRKEGNVMSSAMDNIGKVMEDFVKGINYIKTASENLSRSSEETSAGVEEIASAIADLKSSMEKLRGMIEKLNL